MNRIPVIDRHFYPTIRQYMPTVGHLESSTMTQDSFGEEVPTWSTVSGLERVHCTFGPGSLGGDEEKRLERHLQGYTLQPTGRGVMLDGKYPTIQRGMRLVLDEGGHPGDGQVWNITAIQTDEMGLMTRLQVEEVKL